MKKFLFSVLLVNVLLPACKKNDAAPAAAAVELVTREVTGNLSHPWEIVWGPDGFIWMTERGGRVSRVEPASGTITPLLTIPDVRATGEGGLLGMALHPNFASTPQVFVVYNYDSSGQYREKVVRYTYNGTTLVNPVTIIRGIRAASIHNGSRLLITPDQKLWITTGDANNTALAQNNTALNGKVLRVNLNGSIPSDNPIAGSPVWSKGHRNPQGLVYANNILYSSEHGADTDDEINIIEKNRNYGWPTVRGFCNTSAEQTFCAANNVRTPIQAWTPTIAPSGIGYYNNDLIPQWKNSLLVATLKNARLVQLQLNAQHNGVTAVTEFFTNSFGRLRDVCIAPNGKVYICTGNGSNDKIIEVSANTGSKL